jgi:HEAT repeat protein
VSGKAAGKRILPALAERLGDKSPNVRRLALVFLSRWKSAVKPFHAEIKKLRRDKETQVRRMAKHVFE